MATIPTRLESMAIGSCEEAPALLEQRLTSGGVNPTPVVFNPKSGCCGCTCCCSHIVIPKGFVALVIRHGRYDGQWGAGSTWAPSWVTITHLVPTQSIVYEYAYMHPSHHLAIPFTYKLYMHIYTVDRSENAVCHTPYPLHTQRIKTHTQQLRIIRW